MSEKQDKDLYPKQFVEKRPGFVVKSGTRDAAGKNIDYAVFTDNVVKDLNTLKKETNMT